MTGRPRKTLVGPRQVPDSTPCTVTFPELPFCCCHLHVSCAFSHPARQSLHSAFVCAPHSWPGVPLRALAFLFAWCLCLVATFAGPPRRSSRFRVWRVLRLVVFPCGVLVVLGPSFLASWCPPFSVLWHGHPFPLVVGLGLFVSSVCIRPLALDPAASVRHRAALTWRTLGEGVEGSQGQRPRSRHILRAFLEPCDSSGDEDPHPTVVLTRHSLWARGWWTPWR